MTRLAEAIEGLTEEQRLLLELRLRRKRAAGPRPGSIEARPAAEAPVLSFAQERLWFLDQLDPGNLAYLVPVALKLDGPLSLPAIDRALQGIVERHDVLRTTFGNAGGRGLPTVVPLALPRLPVVDLGRLRAGRREAEAARHQSGESRRPFDLGCGPLLRGLVLRLGERQHVLRLTFHHIVADGWSMLVLTRELTALYSACLRGGGSPLEPLAIQYTDYAAWQRKRLQGGELARQLEHWRRALLGAPASLDLATDRPRPPLQSFRGAQVSVDLEPDLAAGLRALSQRREATLFMTLLAAFDVLLYRLAGQDDLVVGVPVAGRTRQELEPLVGFFVNTLALRADLSGNPRFSDLLERVRHTSLAAFNHQDLPLEKVVEALQPERSLSHSPLFQVLFILQSPPPALELEGLEAALEVPRTVTAKFDLTLTLVEAGERLEVTLEYALDLFDAATARRLLGLYRNLLSDVAAAPGTELSRLRWLGESQRHQLLHAGKGTTRPAGPASTLAEGWTAQVGRTPDRVALRWGEVQVSYSRLDQRAGERARALRCRGVGPEVRVAVCLERSEELVVSLLAVLAAGGAYVPLDPAYPASRLTFMLEDSGARVVVSESRLLGGLGATRARPMLLDRERDPLRSPDADGPTPSPKNLAYVIYTSGSTGRPKGVAIEHRSAVALVDWARGTYGPQQLDGVLAATSVCFDLSVFELFVPLCCGGTVILAADALELPHLPARGRVRLVNTVPSAISELLRMEALPATVTTVNLAGEPLQRPLVEDIYRRAAVDEVWNLYGPSEDTTYSTGVLVPRGGHRPVTIGRPLPNSRSYVLDPWGEPTPVGVPGQLFLAGRGVSRGYLGRPSLTAGCFLPDPFAVGPDGDPAGGRLYRTGDLARCRESGELDFLGRLDHQVKVRGYRIELGEIETVLAEQAEVEEAAVLAAEVAEGDPWLVAFVVPHGAWIGAAELRQRLADRLPAYMVPGAVLEMDALPLTPNGKVDRGALLRHARGRRAERSANAVFVAPRGPHEEVLAGIWADLLARAEIGRHDNFFDLGGHSLLATRLVSRILADLGVEFPLRAVFEAADLAQLARTLAAARRGSAVHVPPLQPVPRDAPLPLSFAQERMWLLDQLEPGNPAYHLTLGVRLDGALDTAGAGGGPERGSAAPRIPAHPVPDPWRQAGPGGGSTGPARAARGRPGESGAGGGFRAGGRPGRRRHPPSVRPVDRPLAARHPAVPRRRDPCGALRPAPRHRRRLVRQHPGS